MAVYDVREISYATESSFCENAATPSSNTWTKRIPVTNASFTADQSRLTDMSYHQRANVSRPGFLGIRTGTFEFTCYPCGHVLTAATSLTENWFQDLLSDGLGGGSTACVGTTISGTSSTANILQVTSAASIAAGDIVRVGTLGDGKGGGQAVAVASVNTAPTPDTVTLLTDCPAAPVTAGHVVYATAIAYPSETMGSTKRFLANWNITDGAFHFMGCQLEQLTMNFTNGGIPEYTFRYRVAYWDKSTTSFPAVSTLESCDTSVFGGGNGSLFINSLATTTRATESVAKFELTLDMPLLDKTDLSSSKGQYQLISGYERGKIVPTVSITIPLSNSPDYFSAYDTDGPSTTNRHIMLTGNGVDKKAYGVYLPNVFPVGPKPTIENVGGIPYRKMTFMGTEHTTTTNDSTRACVKFFQG